MSYKLKTTKTEEKIKKLYNSIEKKIVSTFEDIESTCVNQYQKIENWFVEKLLEKTNQNDDTDKS